MRMFKKIATVATALALTVGMSSSVFAATWGSYFGMNSGWYEGSQGKLTTNTADGWTAQIEQIGWGGVWGGQVFLDSSQKGNAGGINVKKGKKYTLKCTLKSTKCDKWFLIKIAKGDNYAFGKWVFVKKGSSETVNETFTAKCDANSLYFGIGGDFGDRDGVSTDKDAKIRYALAGGASVIQGKQDAGGDSVAATVLSCSGYSLTEEGAEAATQAPNEQVTVAPGGSTGVSTPSSGTVVTNTAPAAVATGDFTPIACGAAAVVAAATIVVFARKRKEC